MPGISVRFALPLPRLVSLIAAAAVLFAVPTPASAQVKVIISGGFTAAYRDLLPQFEKETGITVTTTSGGSVGDGPNTIGGQIRRGVAADVVILTRLAQPTPPLTDARVTFDRLNDMYYASEIWIPGQDGFLLNDSMVKMHTHVTIKATTR